MKFIGIFFCQPKLNISSRNKVFSIFSIFIVMDTKKNGLNKNPHCQFNHDLHSLTVMFPIILPAQNSSCQSTLILFFLKNSYIVYMLFCTILYDISYWIGFLKWRKNKYFAINELQLLKLSDSNQKEHFNPFLETSYAYFSFYFEQKCYF
jgi:hypothetical protein